MTNYLNAIALDDEPSSLEIIRYYSSRINTIQLLKSFTNYYDALDYLKSNQVDLLFLDIEMADINGIEFSKKVEKSIQIIFITAHSQYAISGFDLGVTDYLLKPFHFDRFSKACQNALDRLQAKVLLENQISNSILVKSGYELKNILFNDILFVKSDDNYLELTLTNETVMTRMTLSKILSILPSKEFIKIHRSYIINKHFIESYKNQTVTIQNQKIPVSKSFQTPLRIFLGKQL